MKTNERTAPGFNLGDVYYTLFRHKGKIIFFTLAGILGAVAIYLLDKPMYRSEAKLMIKYVKDSKVVDTVGIQSQVRTPDDRGDSIINSELEILTSRDLVSDVVVSNIGAESILRRLGGGSDAGQAIGAVLSRLKAEVPRRSSVIRVTFEHPDPQVAQLVLKTLTENYIKRSSKIHRAVGFDPEAISSMIVTLSQSLSANEAAINKAKADAGSISIEDSKKALTEELSKIREELVIAEAELTERLAVNASLTNFATSAANPAPVKTAIDPEKTKRYRTVTMRLDGLHRQESDLLNRYNEGSRLVQDVRKQIEELELARTQMEKDDPALALVVVNTPDARRPMLDPAAEVGRIVALQAKITYLTNRYEQVRTNAGGILTAEYTISSVQRIKDQNEARYRLLNSTLEQSRDNPLGSDVSNINTVQTATPGARDILKLFKQMAMVLAAGLVAGLGLAFLLEFYVDQTIKRPIEVENRLGIPLFLTVPKFTNGHSALPPIPAPTPGGETGEPAAAEKKEVATNGNGSAWTEYCEALRDRLVLHFQLNNMLHKPKLVGFTSCRRGSGATTIAAGLAQSLSESSGGNVLLVDMNMTNGPVSHPFLRREANCEMSDALELEKRGIAQVQDNLFVISVNGTEGKKLGVIPKRFASMIPKMKASDYDYIIFDLPPVSQTSPTSKVAGLLDMVFLVVDSGKTNREKARLALNLLSESRSTVAAVLNKYKPYLPESLRTDL